MSIHESSLKVRDFTGFKTSGAGSSHPSQPSLAAIPRGLRPLGMAARDGCCRLLRFWPVKSLTFRLDSCIVTLLPFRLPLSFPSRSPFYTKFIAVVISSGMLKHPGSGPAVQGTEVRNVAEASTDRNPTDPMDAVIAINPRQFSNRSNNTSDNDKELNAEVQRRPVHPRDGGCLRWAFFKHVCL